MTGKEKCYKTLTIKRLITQVQGNFGSMFGTPFFMIGVQRNPVSGHNAERKPFVQVFLKAKTCGTGKNRDPCWRNSYVVNLVAWTVGIVDAVVPVKNAKIGSFALCGKNK